MTRKSRGYLAKSRGKLVKYWPSRAPFAAHSRRVRGAYLLALFHREKYGVLAPSLRKSEKRVYREKEMKTPSYMHFNRTFIKGRYCVTACHHGNT